MLFLFLASLLASDPGLSVNERVEYYEVGGRRYSDFLRNLDRATRDDRASFFFVVEGITADYDVEEDEAGQCRIVDATVDVDLVFLLPQWSLYEEADRFERVEIDRFHAEVRESYDGEVQIVHEHGGAAVEALRAAPAAPCQEMRNQLERTLGQHFEAMNRAIAAHESGTHNFFTGADAITCQQTGTRLRRCW